MVNPPSLAEFLDALVRVRDTAGQRAFVAQSSFPLSQELIEALSIRIRDWLPRNAELAEELTETNLFLASQLDTPLSTAFATQCRAHVLMNIRKNQDAQSLYDRAAELFADAGAEVEFGRTLSASAGMSARSSITTQGVGPGPMFFKSTSTISTQQFCT